VPASCDDLTAQNGVAFVADALGIVVGLHVGDVDLGGDRRVPWCVRGEQIGMVCLWIPIQCSGTFNGMIPRQVHSLLQIDNAMRILSYLLLTMFLMVVLLVGCSGKSESKSGPVEPLSKDQVIAAIEEMGGEVTFDEKNPGKPLVMVDLGKSARLRNNVTNSWLVHLKVLTNLQMLYLGNTKVTDAGLVHLKGLTNLETLDLVGTKVTDAGLVHLKGLTKLQFLFLSYSQVTDVGLVHLKGLTKLQMLYLGDTKVTDAGIKDLQAALPKCKIIH